MSGGTSTAGLIAMGVSAAATIAGTIASSNAQRAQGNAQAQEANYVAAQARQNAGQAQASGQRSSIVQNQATQLAISNARGEAANQGGATTDPTVQTDLTTIGTQGNYRAATAMYEGDAKAQALTNQASGSVYQGQLDQITANTKADTTLISGASSLFNKYATTFAGNNPAAKTKTYTDPEGITSEDYN